jgi:peptidoglycan/LPS O-acetylase OafA/YrhL
LKRPEAIDTSANAIPVAAVRPGGGLRHIRALDGLRGIAYLLVFGHHCFSTRLPPGAWPFADRILINVFSYGSFGVDLFFVLSGYLITTLLLLDRKGLHYFRNFYVKRAFRILPVFLAVIAIIWSTHLVSAAYALLSVFFLASFAQLFHVRSDGPFWSLAVEEQFYLLWPLFIRKLSMRRLRQILWLVIVLEPIIRYFVARGGHAIAYYTFTRCDGLAWGALLATAGRMHRLLEGGARAVDWWRKKGVVALMAGCVLAAAGVMLSFSSVGLRWSGAVMLSACPILFAGLIGYVLTHNQSWVSRGLRNPVLRFFGDISYCSYLVHLYVMDCYDRVAHGYPAGGTGPWLLRAAIILAATTILSTISLYWFERPIMSLRKHFLS